MSHRLHSADEIEHFRRLVDGHAEETIGAFRARFQSPDVSTSNQASRRAIIIHNELTPIVEKRIEAMPRQVEFITDAEAEGRERDTADFNAWFAEAGMEDGRSGQAALGELNEDQEIAGNWAVVAGVDDSGEVWMRVRDTAGLEVDKDPLSPRSIERVRFSWTVELGSVGGDGTREQQYTETFGPEGRRLMLGEQVLEQEDTLEFLPVVIVPRRVRKGSPLGDSGIPALEEAYLSLLWALYQINRANRFAGKVWCSDPAADDGWALPDQDGNKITKMAVVDGAFHPVPMKQVGSHDIPAGALEQYREALDTLYRVGKVRRPLGDTADMRSGKAMLIDTLELRNYSSAKAALTKAGLERIADLWGWLSGRRQWPAPLGVFAQLPDLVQEDPGEQRERGKLWFEARKARELTRKQFLAGWQRLSLIDDDADTDQMADEVDEQEDAAEETRVERMARAIQQAEPSQDQEDAEPPAPPPQGVSGDG